MLYKGLENIADWKGMHPGVGAAKAHQSNGKATLVSYPSPHSPDDPVIVQMECICGDSECFFTAVADDAIHSHFGNDINRSPVYHSPNHSSD